MCVPIGTIYSLMTVLGSKDLLRVKFSGLAADYDRETVVNLYQPIVGYTAMAIYFSLWSLSSTNKYSDCITHEQLFGRMQMAPGRFVESRKLLEATGLLKTYVKTSDVTKKYSYVLYAPKSPKDFFDNTLLYGMLVKCLGVEEVDSIKSKYIDNSSDENGEEISEKFNDVFKPSYDDPAFIYVAGKHENTVGRNVAKIKNCFDYEIFFKEIALKSDIDEKNLSSREMQEIERISLLNGTKEKEAANIVASIYDSVLPKGKRVDFTKLAQAFQEHNNYNFISERKESKRPTLINEDSGLASKINLMETISPKDYLSVLQNGTIPARSDLKLIDDLSKNFGLENCVINAVVDFVLASNDNILSRPYTEKIAASVAREGIVTTIDAMNYLKKVSKKQRSSTVKQVAKTTVEKEKPIVVKNTAKKPIIEDDDDDVSWTQLIDEISTEDNVDGKA